MICTLSKFSSAEPEVAMNVISENIPVSQSESVQSTSILGNIAEYEDNKTDNVTDLSVTHYPEFTYSKDWDVDDIYYLAKIAECEAGNQNIQTKTLVIMTVLNRVESDKFPETIYEVITQNDGNIYQFSPCIPGGSWYVTEPSKDSYEAVYVVLESKYDYSGGALYFESCEETENWHSKNLEFLYQSEDIRFYKEVE
jgi:spore germination cell wall hydrolase CwlJ-like protein